MRCVVFLSVLWAAAASASPIQVAHQGRVIDAAGGPISGAHTVHLTLYDASEGGEVLFTEAFDVVLADGFYSVTLGQDVRANALDHTVFDGSTRYLGVHVDSGAELLPRTTVVSVPYAVRAGTAVQVDGGSVDATEIRVNGEVIIDGSGRVLGTLVGDEDTLRDLGCSDGDIVTRNGGDWLCQQLQGSHTHSAGEVGLGPQGNGNPLNHLRYTDSEAQAAMGPRANTNPFNHDRPTQLACTTVSGIGSTSCWGASYIYCPSGYTMTGGGIQQSNQSLEQSRPCNDGEGQCFVCDNTAGCGTGVCFVRCCRF